MEIFRFSSNSLSLNSCLLIFACLMGCLGCNTEIDPTNPYDPDNPDRLPFGISLELVFPQDGPEIPQNRDIPLRG